MQRSHRKLQGSSLISLFSQMQLFLRGGKQQQAHTIARRSCSLGGSALAFCFMASSSCRSSAVLGWYCCSSSSCGGFGAASAAAAPACVQ